MPTAASRRDNLRFMSVRDATQVALNKWTRIAYGNDKLEDPETLAAARRIHARLSRALRVFNNEH